MSVDHDVDDSPAFFTVEEAAAVLRIGRTAAYELARLFLAKGESNGLPVIRVGRQLRVPRAALEALAGAPITLAGSARVSTAPKSPRSPRPRRSRRPQQPSFPFQA